MLDIVLLALIIALILGYIQYVLKPMRQMQVYKKQFQKNGYRVKMLKYNPLLYPIHQKCKESFSKCNNYQNYYIEELQGYDLVIGNLYSRPHIVFLNPQLMQQFCSKQRQMCYMKDKMISAVFEKILGKGILTTEGHQWKRKRKVLQTIFNYDFIINQAEMIKNSANRLCDQIQLKKVAGQDKIYEFSALQISMDLFSSIVFQGFLGGEIQKQKIGGLRPVQLLTKISDNGMSYDMISMLLGRKFCELGIREKDRQFNHLSHIFNAWGKQFIKRRIQEEQVKIKQQENYIPKDVISAVVSSQIKGSQPEEVRSESFVNELVSQLKTFFLAGTETTSRTFLIIAYFIFKHPQVSKKIREQINETVKNDDFTYETVKDMKYLEAVQKEAIRLIGPANQVISREAIKDHEIKGVNIYKGCSLTNSAITIHYSSQYYKNPHQFRPQRWLNGECDNNNAFSFYGFHGGSRNCIGKHLALLELKIALIIMIRRYKKIEVLCDKLVIECLMTFGAQDFKIRVQK